MIIQGVTLKNVGFVKDPGPPAVTSGLQVYYDPSNSASYSGGATITDLSGRGRNGTVSGSPVDAGSWLTMTGTQYVQTPNLGSAWSGWQHTIEVWLKPTAVGVGWVDSDSTSYNGGYHTTGDEFYSVGPFVINNTMIYNGGTGVTRAGGGTTPLNAWYQVVRTYNGSNTAIGYVNGVAAASTSVAWTTPVSNTWYLTFGAGNTTFFATGAAFQGSMGIIRIYDRQLSGAEVLQNYNASKSIYGLA